MSHDCNAAALRLGKVSLRNPSWFPIPKGRSIPEIAAAVAAVDCVLEGSHQTVAAVDDVVVAANAVAQHRSDFGTFYVSSQSRHFSIDQSTTRIYNRHLPSITTLTRFLSTFRVT